MLARLFLFAYSFGKHKTKALLVSAFRFENDIGEKIGFFPSNHFILFITQTAAKSGSYLRSSKARGEIRVAALKKARDKRAFFNSIRLTTSNKVLIASVF